MFKETLTAAAFRLQTPCRSGQNQFGLDQAADLLCRVDVRRAARLAGAEVISRRRPVPGVFDPDMSCEAADSFQPRVALGH